MMTTIVDPMALGVATQFALPVALPTSGVDLAWLAPLAFGAVAWVVLLVVRGGSEGAPQSHREEAPPAESFRDAA